MVTPYDYVQLVSDDDWGLVGIIPNGGSANMSKSHPSESLPENLFSSARSRHDVTQFQHGEKITQSATTLPSSSELISSPTGSFKRVPEATVINRRRPFIRHGSVTEPTPSHIYDPPITRAMFDDSKRHSPTISLHGQTMNSNILNGLGTLQSPQSPEYKSHPSDLVSHVAESSSFGEISNLRGSRNLDSILVGFGR